MNISAEKSELLAREEQMLIVPFFEEDTDHASETYTILKERFGNSFTRRVKQDVFFGQSGQMMSLGENIFVVGIGKKERLTLSVVREAIGLAVMMAKMNGVQTIAAPLLKGKDDAAKIAAQAIAESALLANYAFSLYKKLPASTIESLVIVTQDGRELRHVTTGIEKARITAEATILARDLVNTPAREMTPTHLADAAFEIAKKSGGAVQVQVHDQAWVKKQGMGAYLGVDQGSDEPLKFIHLTYTPKKAAKKSVAVVGKGITFDSGGLSIKPGNAMETMKCDMAGAAAVLGLFSTLHVLEPSVKVHGIIAATENMPSGRAMRPGDVVRAANGKTIEVLNTDAEGRMTLADALTYAQKQKPDYVIDLATLTGACVAALGEEIAGLMSNDAKFANEILMSAARTSEKMWELPLENRYMPLIQSDIADLRNISRSRYGGALTAGLFLREFINPGQKWAHLDIAGPAFAEIPLGTYIPRGGTGFGVRTLVDFVESVK